MGSRQLKDGTNEIQFNNASSAVMCVPEYTCARVL